MAWTPNERIPGQKSKASPALSATGTTLHMVHLGDTSNQIWHSRYEGEGPWTENKRILNQFSKASPALAGGLMVHLGNTSNRIWRSSWINGSDWTDNSILVDIETISGRGGSNVSPALASLPRGVVRDESIAMVYKRAESDSIVLKFFSEPGVHVTFTTTRAAPALAFHRGTLHMVHLGESSKRLWHAIWDQESGLWNEKEVEGQSSKASPALASFNGRLHMVHLGDSSNNIWHSVYIDDLRSWTEDRIEGQASKAPPALAVFREKLHMVHLGNTSNDIWHSTWQD